MKFFTAIITALSLLAFSTNSLSQKNFLPGVLVFQNGDSIKGLIDYRSWDINPKKIDYKSSADSKVESFTPLQLKYFKVYGKEEYMGVTFWVTNMPDKAEKIDNQVSVNDVKRTAFLRIILKGAKLTLFELTDSRKHYFLKPVNDSIRELRYGKFSYNLTVGTDDTYRKQLKALVTNTANRDELIKSIETSEYNKSDLIKIVGVINEDTQKLERRGSSKMKITPYIGAGLTYNKIIFSLNSNVKNLENTGSPISYIISGGFDLESSAEVRKLFFRLSLSYSTFAYVGEEKTQTEFRRYRLGINSFTPAISANFAIRNTKNSSLYLGVGPGYNFSSYTGNEYYYKNIYGTERTNEKILVPENGWLEVFGRLGYTYKKMDVQLTSRFTGTFEKFDKVFTVKSRYNTNGLIFSYRF
ncbi:MAG TPA: hypothetical protein VF622_11825 [Segetibacter sp.]|jgi:hypothetical protein